MGSRQISLNCVMAALFGVKAMLFLAVELVLFVTGRTEEWTTVFGQAAILCCMVSATLAVRGFLLDTRAREKRCFDAGREVGRTEAGGGEPPTSLQSVR